MNKSFWKTAGKIVALFAVLGLIALSFFPQGIQSTAAPAATTGQ
jgi:hypothetical protein